MKKIYLTISILICLAGQTMKAQIPQLWGLTNNCGTYNSGSIIKINEDGTGFQTMYSFDTLLGIYSSGPLCLGSERKLYGVQYYGGIDTAHHAGHFSPPGYGVLYSFDPVYHVYSVLHNFDFISGVLPLGSIIQLSNGKLYGACSWGGVDSNGVIFSYDPTTQTYADLYDFPTLASGVNPHGGLLLATDGKLYGTTWSGGSTSYMGAGAGVLFSFDPTNNTCSNLHNFDLLTGNGTRPNLIQASNGKIYSTTEYGGDTLGYSMGRGVIYNYDPTSNIYTDLFNDTIVEGQSSLIKASNGKLYGSSGAKLFSFDISNNNRSILHNFSSSIYNDLFQGSNGKLFGATYTTLFSIDTLGNNATTLYTFNCHVNGAFIELPANTGINEISMTNSISISPNPFTTTTTLTLQGTYHNPSLFIYNLLGQEVRSIPIGTNKQITIPRNQLPSGMYFYKLIEDNKEVLGIGKLIAN